jgi:hypothetical protein
MNELPEVPEDLLLALEERYPDRAPDGTEQERQVWINAGSVKVIRQLRNAFNEQNETILGEANVQT